MKRFTCKCGTHFLVDAAMARHAARKHLSLKCADCTRRDASPFMVILRQMQGL